MKDRKALHRALDAVMDRKMSKDSNEEANARHALYNGERAAQRQDYRAAVTWFTKAEELFKDAGLTKEANRAAVRAMECEDYRGKKDVDKGSKK
jgi:TPR repeat protein